MQSTNRIFALVVCFLVCGCETTKSTGLAKQPSLSELYVFLLEPSVTVLVSDRQFVKYRVTYPVSRKAEAEPGIASFLSELAWPAK